MKCKKTISVVLGCSLLLGVTTSCGRSGVTASGLTEEVNLAPEHDETKAAGEILTADENQTIDEVEEGFENLVTEFDISNAVNDNYRNFYEIFPGYFYDSDGDGMGDLNGITMKLDYIAELGCNGIWLTPIMEAPSYHKYDTVDYYKVDSSLGTNDDFRKLADTCHDKGINIIIDLVVNHSSSENIWFKEACDYLRGLAEDEEPDETVCPYVGYYNFSREQKDSTYREVTSSDWYYEAVFDYSQPDLNLYNEEVRLEIMKIADFWMNLGVDGFRMDAAMHYDDSSEEFNVTFLNELYMHCCETDPDFYMVSEVWSTANTIAAYYESDTPSFFNFDVADSEGKLIKAGRGTLGAENFILACENYQDTYGSVYADYIDAPFITNHDMGRVANALMCDPVSMKMTAGFLLTMSGSPFIYYGEEIGMKSKGKQDENKRLHMNWSEEDLSGICRDPLNADKDIVQDFPAEDVQSGEPDSLLAYYREALAIRNAFPQIARGKFEMIDELSEGNIAVAKKEWNGETIYIAYNNGDELSQIPVSSIINSDVTVVGLLEADTHNTKLTEGILYLDKKGIAVLK